jgi:DNA-binding transcriptional regulator GbsR (MarR family)
MEDSIFSPRHIPYFIALTKEPYKLPPSSVSVYGFIVFYLVYLKREHFTFSDPQLSEILGLSLNTVQESLKRLQQSKLITRQREWHEWKKNYGRSVDIVYENYHILAEGGNPRNWGDGTPKNWGTKSNINNKINKINKNKDLLKYIHNPDSIFRPEEGSIPNLPF